MSDYQDQLDMGFVRGQFPALAKEWAFFDNAGGSQTLQGAMDRIVEFLTHRDVQIGGSYEISQLAAEALMDGRRAAQTFVNAARPEEIVFGPSTTALVQTLAAAMRSQFAPGDEIIVTHADHESNIGPWERLRELGVVIKVCQNPLHNVIADGYELPFLEKSFDVAILTHQLDYARDPHRLLREVDRVMMDDGYLIITGFNPFSFTGLASLFPWRKNNLPWSGRMFSSNRVQDWLGLLNYQVIHRDRYALFPMTRYRTMWTWFENSLGEWASPAGSLYYIVARKRTYPLKPIKPHWRLKKKLTPLGVMNREGAGVKKMSSDKH